MPFLLSTKECSKVEIVLFLELVPVIRPRPDSSDLDLLIDVHWSFKLNWEKIAMVTVNTGKLPHHKMDWRSEQTKKLNTKHNNNNNKKKKSKGMGWHSGSCFQSWAIFCLQVFFFFFFFDIFSCTSYYCNLQIFDVFKFGCWAIMERSVSFKFRCPLMLSGSLNVFFRV